jgi:hypothetical protein
MSIVVDSPSVQGFRAPVPAALHGLAAQRIPRRILQTGLTFADTLATHRDLMQKWWQLNPEYAYMFYSDAGAMRFVEKHASRAEQEAYRAVRTGAQKADLFRILALRYLGGVYADADMELRKPLRDVVPTNASGVVGRFWGSEFMAFERGHPLLVRALRIVTANVHRQVKLIKRGNSSTHCGSPHSCVLQVTGPFALRESFSRAAHAMSCKLPLLPADRRPGAKSGGQVCPKAVRETHVCIGDKGNIYRNWACDAAYHWDCRNSGAKRKCSTKHYSRYRGKSAARMFFNLSAITASATRF